MCIPCRNHKDGSASIAPSAGVHRKAHGSLAAAGAARALRGAKPPNLRLGTPYATATSQGATPGVVMTRRWRAAYNPNAPTAAVAPAGSSATSCVRPEDMAGSG